MTEPLNWTTYLKVLLKPTSPNSLNLAWKVLKGDTIRLQPWFIIRRVSWLYIVATPMGAIKITKVMDYKGIITCLLAMGNLGMESGVYHSRRPFWPRVCYPHCYRAHSPKLIESARWSFLLFQDGVSSAYSFPPSTQQVCLIPKRVLHIPLLLNRHNQWVVQV